MADDKKISALPDATLPLNDADLFEVVQGGVNKKAPKSAVGGGAVDSVNGQTGVVVLGAGDIPFTPAGTIAATDVQAAIVELDGSINATPIIGEILNIPGTAIPAHTDVAGTANFSVVSGKLRYAPTTSVVSLNVLDVPWKNVEIEVKMIVCPVTSPLSAATTGFRIGLFSTAPAAYSPDADGNLAGGIRTTNTNPGSAFLHSTDAAGTVVVTSAISGDNLTLAAGDEVIIRYVVTYSGHTVHVTKTSNSRIVTYSEVFNSIDNAKGFIPATWKLFLQGDGGEYDIEYITVDVMDTEENDVLIIGDSNVNKSHASTFNNAFAYRIKNAVKNAIVLGFPAYTATNIEPYIDQVIATQTNKPIVFLLIGTNDARGNDGATTASWLTDYGDIITKFITAGWTADQIILGKVPPTASGANNTNVNTINASMDTNFPTYRRLEVNALTNVGGVATTLNFNADLVHFNDVGHALVYRILIQMLRTYTGLNFLNKSSDAIGSSTAYIAWVPTYGASQFGSAPTSVDATYYTKDGFTHVQISMGAGTSTGSGSGVSFTITNWPVAPRRTVNALMLVQNSSTVQAGRLDIPGGSATATIYATPAAGGFTLSAAKGAFINITYES